VESVKPQLKIQDCGGSTSGLLCWCFLINILAAGDGYKREGKSEKCWIPAYCMQGFGKNEKSVRA
jgi:hypothetical protein